MLSLGNDMAILNEGHNFNITDLEKIISYADSSSSVCKILSYLFIMNDNDDIRYQLKEYAKRNNYTYHLNLSRKKEQLNKILQSLKAQIFSLDIVNKRKDQKLEVNSLLFKYINEVRISLGGGKAVSIQETRLLLSMLMKTLHEYNNDFLSNFCYKSKDTFKLKKQASSLKVEKIFSCLQKKWNKNNLLNTFFVKPNSFSKKKNEVFYNHNKPYSHPNVINIRDNHKIKNTLKKISRMNVPTVFLDDYSVKHFMSDAIFEYFKIKVFLHNIFLYYIPVFFYFQAFKDYSHQGCWLTALRTVYTNLTGQNIGFHNDSVKEHTKNIINSDKVFNKVLQKFLTNRNYEKAKGINGALMNELYPKLGFVLVDKVLKKKFNKKLQFRSNEDFTEENITRIIKSYGPIYLSTSFESIDNEDVGHAIVILGFYNGKVYYTDMTFTNGQIGCLSPKEFLSAYKIFYQFSFCNVKVCFKNKHQQMGSRSLINRAIWNQLRAAC